jgi:hypothetical protein
MHAAQPVLLPQRRPGWLRASRTGCLKDLNEVAVHHNSPLQESLKSVRRNHPSAVVVYADFFTPVIEMVESPHKFGQ